MAIDGLSGRTSYIGSGILNLRAQLDMYSQQLASGKVSTTYAGQGNGRGLAITLRAQINAMASYADTATNVNTRLGVGNLALERLVAVGTSVKGAAVAATSTIDNIGQTPGQKTANLAFIDSVDLLNVRAGDRYLFSGRATDIAPVASSDAIMNGVGAQDGLKTVIAERRSADLGVDGMGRLVSAATSPTAMSLAEDASPSAFGLKLTNVNSSLTGATVTGPTGVPAQIDVDLGPTNPLPGDKIKFTFTLPDGTFENIELTASTADPLPAGSFAIGADSTATAANLKTTMDKAVRDLANGAMVAASAIEAGNNFFDQPPMRVDTSALPLGQATSLVAGTTANTVMWYQGESGADLARNTALAKVDDSITVAYGARANEQALRAQLQTVAVYAAVTFAVSSTVPQVNTDANAQISALNLRVAQNLAKEPGTQSIEDLQADFAGAQTAVKSATQRQTQTKAMSQSLLASIEGINDNEVATKILALQTALEASYRTTSTLYQMSLVKFI